MFCLWNCSDKLAKQSAIHYSNASLWVSTREAYWPFLSNNSKCVPNSAIFPSEHKAIWSAFWTVLNLWAITKVVRPFIRWSRASWTRRSLIVSKALVACRKYRKQGHIHQIYLVLQLKVDPEVELYAFEFGILPQPIWSIEFNFFWGVGGGGNNCEILP